MDYDVIVIGVGSMGSATIYNLAKRRQQVLGLEQFNIGHDLGSAHGVNRIIRLAYFESPKYVPLLRRAYTLWDRLEKIAGEEILIRTGSLDAGPDNGKVVSGSLKSCRRHRLNHTLLSATDVRRRFPGFNLPDGMSAVHQPDGGFVLSERAVIAYVQAAQDLGADIHGRERVLRWQEKRGRVLVETDRSSYTARKLVITAGAWAERLVPALRRRRLAAAQRQVMIWTQPKKPELFSILALPVFNLETVGGEQADRYYGFPIYGIPGFKIGKYYHRRQSVDPDHMDRSCHLKDERVLRQGIRQFFPEADGPTMAMKTCLFANSPDKHFVLDRHPRVPYVTIAAGFSGHGFKFSSVVGEIMADLTLEGRSRRFKDLALFSITRPRIEAD